MRATIHHFSCWIDQHDPDILMSVFKTLLENSGFKIQSVQEKRFEPYGYTALFLLSESHFAVHTFPEHGTTYIELSSCVREQYDRFIKNLPAL